MSIAPTMGPRIERVRWFHDIATGAVDFYRTENGVEDVASEEDEIAHVEPNRRPEVIKQRAPSQTKGASGSSLRHGTGAIVGTVTGRKAGR